MKKTIATLLSICILVGTSFTVLADNLDKTEITQPIIHKQKEVILQLGQTLALIDGEEYQLKTVPKVIEGRTYLPLRFTADKLLEADVLWDAKQKKVTIIKDATKVEVKIASNNAYINGDQVILENTAIIDKDTTYLPLRVMAELFGVQINYDQASKKVTLIKKEGDQTSLPVIKKPVAQFSFQQAEYTAGQLVQSIDESYHEDNDPITNRVWKLNFNEKQTNHKLENMFSKPVAGTYSVSLKVEAGKGNWSDWVTRQITIHPNRKPVITSFQTVKDSYAGGEMLEFTHLYDNEPWEEIQAERWTYRKSWEPLNKAVIDKPQAIFSQGKYIVTLSLQDAYGNWSDTRETEVNINEETDQRELEYRFSKGKPGDIIDNFHNFNYRSYDPIIPDQIDYDHGTLIVSNSPENVRQNGILYRDLVEGSGRILFHHHNVYTEEENQLESKRIVLLAENPTSQPVSFTISNKVLKGPSTDVLFIGQQILYDYLKGSESTQYTLQAGEKMFIHDSSQKRWTKGQLLSGQMDFNTQGKIHFIVAAVGENTHINDIGQLPDLAKDAHPRGTFDKTDINYKINLTGNEPSKIVLGAGQEEWIEGYDSMLGGTVQNRGNFAVNYRLEITAGEEDVGLLLNPRAGVFRGALKWDGEEPFLAPSKGYFMGHNSKGVMLGVVKAGQTKTLTYSLPSGSASPVLLVFMPKSHW